MTESASSVLSSSLPVYLTHIFTSSSHQVTTYLMPKHHYIKVHVENECKFPHKIRLIALSSGHFIPQETAGWLQVRLDIIKIKILSLLQ
jgi:hypothetical protein